MFDYLDKLINLFLQTIQSIIMIPIIIKNRFITPPNIWSNWSGQVMAIPKEIFHPESLDEIIQIVKDSKKFNYHIRCIGSSHSYSPLCETNEYMIQLDKLTNVELGPILDSNKYGRLNHTIRIQAGTLINKIDAFLDQNNLVIGSNVVFDTAVFVGVVSTGCHGTGLGYKIISDNIYQIRIVNSDGELITFTDGETESDIFNAVKTNLGLFGITYDILFRVEQNTNVHQVNTFTPYDQIITPTQMKNFLTQNEWFEMYWFPFSDQVFTKYSNRVSDSLSWWQLVKINIVYDIQTFISAVFTTGAIIVFEWVPKLVYIAGLHRFFFLFTSNQVQPLRNSVHYQKYIDYTPKSFEVEMAVGFNPDDAGYSRICDAINDATNLFKTFYAETNTIPACLGLNIRFTSVTDTLISPANLSNYKYVMWIEFIAGAKSTNNELFAQKYLRLFMNKYDAYPHWGKYWQIVSTDEIKKGYGDRLAKFNSIKKHLGVDPSGIFVNKILCDIFSNNKKK
jgi:hypothetical protein